MNPIRAKLEEMMQAGLTKEHMCVTSGLKYPTFDNVFKKLRISYGNLKALKYCGLINEEDERDYHKWIIDNNP